MKRIASRSKEHQRKLKGKQLKARGSIDIIAKETINKMLKRHLLKSSNKAMRLLNLLVMQVLFSPLPVTLSGLNLELVLIGTLIQVQRHI